MKHPVGVVKNRLTSNNIVMFDSNDLINVTTADNTCIDPRLYGSFTGKGWFLSPAYNWQIITDETGDTILVPTKRSD